MANIPDDEIRRDELQRRVAKYAKRTAAKLRKVSESKGARGDIFRRGRRLSGSAYGRKG